MIWPIFKKSLKEQLRNCWILLLTISLAPFFVFVYYLINEASQPSYDILILNQDGGPTANNQQQNLGEDFFPFVKTAIMSTPDFPLTVALVTDSTVAREHLQAKQADLLLIIPPDFSAIFNDSLVTTPELETMGDLTNTAYLVSAVWLGEVMNEFILMNTGKTKLFSIKETAIGRSGQISEFDLWMPGILILSIIMLMFSATIAFVSEVDQRTILRLKLSNMEAWQFLLGVGSVQVLVGICAIFLTLATAAGLGFKMQGSVGIFLLIAILTSISMVAFSLILAAFTRSVTEVLIMGNFPLFLFMFFSGAAFPIQSKAWFQIAGYGVSWQSSMSPAPAINALNKVSIMGAGFNEIIGEIIVLLSATVLYFLIGIWFFQKRHLRTI